MSKGIIEREGDSGLNYPRAAVRSIAFGLFLTMTLGLGSCTGTPPVPLGSICPTPVSYTLEQQQAAAKELQALAPGSMLGQMIVDYGRERAVLRACKAPTSASYSSNIPAEDRRGSSVY